jgi:hypothetical protein
LIFDTAVFIAALAYVGFQHLATLTEWNGKFYTKDAMDSIIGERVESQKRLLAQLYSEMSGQDSDLVYQALRYDNTVGGNANFSWNDSINPQENLSGLSNGRMPGMPSIHLKPRGDEFRLHVDTANPASMIPLGAIVHGLADVVFGNINGRIPILR